VIRTKVNKTKGKKEGTRYEEREEQNGGYGRREKESM